jgi:GDPmannose 4,6-dehydratase
MTKRALIFGVTGQDGSYLTEILLEKGYEVHGVIRRSSSFNTKRIDHLIDDVNIMGKTLFIHYGDVTDPLAVNTVISTIKPHEVYNLAAQSHVKVSFDVPYYTAQTDAIGTLNILEAVKVNCPSTKVYQASTSELYGGQSYNMPDGGYTEESPFHPRSPYGCAKIYGYWITKNYREAYNIFACNGLLFNHESPRRGDTFVTKKITNWCHDQFKNIKDKNGIVSPLRIGNINAYRDWGHAKDYCEAMHLILQQDEPDDFVIATGETHTVKEFIEACFEEGTHDVYLKDKIQWVGVGEEEKGYYKNKLVVVIDKKYFRPSEVDYLLGNPAKAKKQLNWKPKYDFKALVKDMMKGTK